MDFVWEAVKESLIMFPFLFGAYVLVELIEFLTSKKLNGNVLKSRVAPLVGAGVGLLPQCGFGVVASDLYSKRKITMGTLLAIFLQQVTRPCRCLSFRLRRPFICCHFWR